MSKARSRRVRPSSYPATPEEGSPGWLRVISRGCGGYRFDTPNGSDYDCRHNYVWSCDECPCCIQSNREKEAIWVAHVLQMAGPPRGMTESYRLFWYPTPSVAAELLFWYSMEDIAEFLEVFKRLGVVVNLVPESKNFFDLELPC